MDGTITFVFDFLSPFAYLARHELARIAAAHGAAIAYRAVDLATIKQAAGNTGPGNRDMPVKLAYMKTDLARWAAHYGVPFGWVGNYASRRMNLGLGYAHAQGQAAEYVREAFAAGWVRGARLDDELALRGLAAGRGWHADDFMHYLDTPAADAIYRAATESAIAQGVFGVPTMIFDEQMWWGNDRLFMLEQTLRQLPSR